MEDTEFAIIQKKGDDDFLYLLEWEKKEIELMMKSFDMFNFWFERKLVKFVVPTLEKKRKPIVFGKYLYKSGEPADDVFYIKTGRVELTYKSKKPNKFKMISGVINVLFI